MSVWLLSALACYLAGAIAVWAFPRRRSGAIGSMAAVLGGALAMVPCLGALAGRAPWHVTLILAGPFGPMQLGVDPLSGFFGALIALVGGLCAVYGTSYLAHAPFDEAPRGLWAAYDLMIMSLLLVVVSRDGWLFLLAWEGMALSSYFLVVAADRDPGTRHAGWMYLVASHLGAACLLPMFLLLGHGGSLAFEAMSASGGIAIAVFILALLGFGTKAGFMPFHIWLPEAHPAAPSPVSALMSGVLIKTGIYGLLRVALLLGHVEAWWGWTLLGVGIVSGILGVVFALAQRDIKRLLAYSSVENMGIIAMGLGLGWLGVAWKLPVMASLGFAGALWHVLNHSMFKSLLFMGAGALAHAAGTRDLDRMGGLLRRMPWTGTAFLVGSVAIVGLPPLNGFVGEFLLYRAAWGSLRTGVLPLQILPGVLTLVALALIGGLAAAAFAKVGGIALLGEPRSEEARAAHDPRAPMVYPMVLLALICVALGLASFWLWPEGLLESLLKGYGANPTALPRALSEARAAILPIAAASGALIVLVGVLALIRGRWLAARSVASGPTWGCGYAAPDPHMQYSSASFVQPLTALFQAVLQPMVRREEDRTLYPRILDFVSHTPDFWQRRLVEPIFHGVALVMDRLRWIQGGNAQLYVLYIALTLVFLLLVGLR